MIPKFIIERFPLLPGEIVRVPNGEVLFTAFIGQAAYVWVKIAEGEELTMGLVAVPNGGPYEMGETEEFLPAVHVGSFLKRSQIKTSTVNDAGVVFHCFCWKPKIPLPELWQGLSPDILKN